MSNSDECLKPPISPPVGSAKREIARALTESVIEVVPGGGVVTGLGRAFLPSKAERARQAWEDAISTRTNEHSEGIARLEAHIAPAPSAFDALALQVISAISHACPNGLAEIFHKVDDIQALLSDKDTELVQIAVQDLVAAGLLEERALIGSWSVRPTQRFYEELDGIVMSWNTRHDAVEIAELMLQHQEAQSPELHEMTGWPLRRFNPALTHIFRLHSDWAWRNSYHFDFCSYGLVIGAKEKAGLKQFVLSAQ